MQNRMNAAARAASSAAAVAGYVDLAADAVESWGWYAAGGASVECAMLDAAFQAACAATAAAAAAAGPDHAAAWSAVVADHASFCAVQADAAASAGFEWVDGILLDAMAAGDWLLLDNANLCSPTVLDRLNPLLEPGGDLLIPEAGLVRGVPRCAFPAPGFRLLLALDPRHGEVSRAMRNRGIEVFMLPSNPGGAADEVRRACAHRLSCLQSFPSANSRRRALGHAVAHELAARLCAQQTPSNAGGFVTRCLVSTTVQRVAWHLCGSSFCSVAALTCFAHLHCPA